MDEDLKAKWTKALRSGEYPQGQRLLYKDGAYCCLGVLHRIAVGETPPSAWSDKPAILKFIDDPLPGGGEGCAHTRLVAMNDAGKTFAEIAEWIDANL